MITSDALQSKMKDLLVQKEQKIADINAINGALQAYSSVLEAMNIEKSSEIVNESAPEVSIENN